MVSNQAFESVWYLTCRKYYALARFINCIKYQVSYGLFYDSLNTPNYSYSVDWLDHRCLEYLWNVCDIKCNISLLSWVLRENHEESPRGKPVCRTRFHQVPPHNDGQDGVGGITTVYGMDGPGIEFRWGLGFPCLSRPAWRTAQPPVQYVPGLFRGKVAEAWCWPSTPF